MKQITIMKTESKHHWPHWLPKSSRISVRLTKEQKDYILPAFNTCRNDTDYGKPIDGVSLVDNCVSGNRIELKAFLKRFEFSDLDLSNLIEATL